ALSATYKYDSYGNTLSSSGSMAAANLYRFSSKEVNLNYTDSGIYYYGYRWYEPNLQRWLNPDPIEEEGGINLYGFVYNNPIGDFDKDGWAPHKKKRPSTHDKHTKPRPGRPGTKQRQKPGWIDRKTGQ